LANTRWAEAKCLDIDITKDDPFFSDDEVDQEEAANFCNGTVDGKQCAVRNSCLLHALSMNCEYGVFGGLTALERKILKKKLPSKRRKANPEWRWMDKEELLQGVSQRTIEDLRRSLDDQSSQAE
jgi:hypothetical protein